jgi:UDP-glucose 4-epimerase
MKNILITGGLGYVGGRLARELSKSNHVMISSRKIIDDHIRSAYGEDVSYIPHDSLLNAQSFPNGIDSVIHLASLNEIDAVKFPSLAVEVNTAQTKTILGNSIEKKVDKFIYFSTTQVYGQPLSGEITEQTQALSVHPYATTHKAAEDHIAAAHESGKIEGVVLRLSNSFGAPVLPTVDRWTLLVNNICRQVIETGSIHLTSNGCQYRDFITLTDVVDAVKFVVNTMTKDKERIFNLSSGKSITVMEMSELVASVATQMFTRKIPVYLPENSQPTVENHFHISSTLIQSKGLRLQHNFEKELSDLLSFCNVHFN